MNNVNDSQRLPVALIGLGAIGRMHLERLLVHPAVAPAGVADPSDAAREHAARLGVPWFADYRALLDAGTARAAIVATPNATHADVGLACVDRGLPLLMEKPIADTVESARRLCDGAAAAGVPLMVGHQRRHNPILQRARRLIVDGAVGRPVSANAMATWLKPDSYFEPAWRREAGGGPVLINLIHDIDLLRFLLGEIDSVLALASNAVRGFAVEDTAGVVMRFASGAIGTLAVSDATVAPWNWDLAAGEAAHYAQVDVDSHRISGTEGSITLPRLDVWRYDGTRGWQEPLTRSRQMMHRGDPYVLQLHQLRAVAEGREAPLCSGVDGLRTLQAALGVLDAARSAQPVELERQPP